MAPYPKMLVATFLCVLSAASQTVSFTALKAKAEAGDAKAQNELANEYRESKTFSEAAKWYAAAAKQGYAAAMFNLGTMHYNGDGVPPNLQNAYVWFLIASVNGDSAATDALKRTESEITPGMKRDAEILASGTLRRGESVPKNTGKGVEILSRLASEGDPEAQITLAYMLISGREISQDLNAAAAQCRAAAKKNYSPGMVCLGYLDQVIEPKDYKDAFDWYKRASELRSPIGSYGLGLLYADGLGVKKDNVKAAVYLADAAPAFKLAQEALLEIEKRLTEEERMQLKKEKPVPRRGLGPSSPYLGRTIEFPWVMKLQPRTQP